MKRQLELFSRSDYMIFPLTEAERKEKVDQIYEKVLYGIKYMYSRREVAGVLRITMDELQTLLDFYKIDSVKIRAIVRIPWWSLCEYLLDPAEDLEVEFYKYMDLIPSKTQKSPAGLHAEPK